MKSNDIKIYNLGRQFLNTQLAQKGKNENLLDKHLSHPLNSKSLNDVYLRLLISGANRERAWNVITSPIKEIANLNKVLFGFDCIQVENKYSNDHEKLLKDIVKEFDFAYNPNNSGLWIQYSKTILSGAKFLNQFKDFGDFDSFAQFFHSDDRARNALPLILQEQIHGFRLALSCDFLKELGYYKFGKPDVHIKKIFLGTDLTQNSNDYEVLLAISRVAENNNVSPYNVDKLFWLIGSGKFYLEKDSLGKIFKLKRNAETFIQFVKKLITN